MKNYYDYKNPPTNINDVEATLKYFGCKTCDCGSRVAVFDYNRLPKLSCPKKDNPLAHVVLSFPGPPGFGLQSFSFDAELLISAVNSFSKYGIPFNVSLNSANRFVNFILSYFVVNPTIIKRVYYHKRGNFKLPLQPSPQKIFRTLKKNN